MSAIRLARGFTGRRRDREVRGCYHGHADSLLVKAGSGLLTFGNPSSAACRRTRQAHHRARLQRPAAGRGRVQGARRRDRRIIVEPVAGNMNLICPDPGFLEGLRRICTGTARC